ncbi:MAG TPA: hypothetical protein VM901_12885 [Bdellovibrionota bacterium]|jgi:hypothetical protein|nr:hypothetical protein [Bdellovibrionota bacterium]
MKTWIMGAALVTSQIFTGVVHAQDQQIDINKVNAVLSAATEKALPEYAEVLDSASFRFDPLTFDLDRLVTDVTAKASFKKTAWQNVPARLWLTLGTSIAVREDGEKLAAKLNGTFNTSVLSLAQYLAAKGIDKIGESREEIDVILLAYFNDVMTARQVAAVWNRTLVLAERVKDIEGGLHDFFNQVKLHTVGNTLTVTLPTYKEEFFGIEVGGGMSLDDNSISLKLDMVDIDHSFKEQIDASKEDLKTFMVELQNAVGTKFDDVVNELSTYLGLFVQIIAGEA